MSNNSPSYGVGPAAEKLNIGATVNAVSVQDDEGKVTDKESGKVLYDPAKDSVELIEKDGELSAQAEGTEDKDEDDK